MDNIKNFAEKHEGHYKEENIKNVYSLIGRMIYQPKRANFIIDGSKISLNIDEVGGAIPTAEPFRITLHLNEFRGNSIEIYPATFLDIIFHKILPLKKRRLKNTYIFKGNEKHIDQLVKDKSLLKNLQKQKVYIRIPKENTSKIILTPPHGIESETQLESFIEILKNIEVIINEKDVQRN